MKSGRGAESAAGRDMSAAKTTGRGPAPEEVAVYRRRIVGEICYALGLRRDGLARRLLAPLFGIPAVRFGRIAALADLESGLSGISGAARRILPDLSLAPTARGTENIPGDGPLLVVSNHPGAYDSVAILSCIPRRDIKVFISDVGFTRAFSTACGYFIYVPKIAAGRSAALRESIEHLRSGGALLIFAHGEVEPDPELSPGADEALQDWSRSVEIMLRQVPETWLQVAVASGVLMPKFLRHPLVKIRKTAPRRQKLAEVLQICQQMLLPRTVRTDVHISFARPVRGKALAGVTPMTAVTEIARRLLQEHLAAFSASRAGVPVG
jgi:1-acyl-sn-glycerol-3-phosphate acyltransferase